MADEMFFSPDSRSLKRGRRVAKRTPTRRACVLWPSDAPEMEIQGLVLDITPYGMLVRLAEPMPVGTEVRIQLMRDEGYNEPLSIPVEGCIVRHAKTTGTYTDHGIRVEQKALQRANAPAVRGNARLQARTPTRSRMHTIDITVGDDGVRRTGR